MKKFEILGDYQNMTQKMGENALRKKIPIDLLDTRLSEIFIYLKKCNICEAQQNKVQ